MALFMVTRLPAQSPTPKLSVTLAPSPVVVPPPSSAALINAMDSAEVQQAITLLKSNFIRPAALNGVELERATFEGLMARLGHGVMLLPAEKQPEAQAVDNLYSEILEGHIGYMRLGELSAAHLQAMDGALKTFAAKKVDALVIDLRATPPTNDFATAAEFLKRFVQKGKMLFTLRKPVTKQDRVFSSDRDPVYDGMIIVLADIDTSGAGEVLAGVLRAYDKAMIIGQPTAGRAVEYSDLPLSGGKILRVAVAEFILPEGKTLFPVGAIPDVPVEMSATDKRQVFEQSLKSGMASFVFEKERPHFNEAALLAGTNPEIDVTETT
ncbi:MAG: S41 family peptidase, partial [Verrucomicrobiota bacterium]